MKKIGFLRVVLALSVFGFGITQESNAQVSTYSFAQATSTFTALTATYTEHGTGTVDDVTYTAIPIGFTFFYNCNAYTTVSICSNGFLAMGSSVTSSYTPISSGTSNNVISAMGHDLQGLSTGSIRTKLTGTAPNRRFTIEWLHFETYGGADDYSFQIVLVETSNVIQINYTATTIVAGNTFEVGLRGASTADFNNRTKANATSWTASTAGALNTDVMSTGGNTARNPNGTFTWTPTALSCSGTPTAGTSSASPTSITSCASLTTSLNLTGASTGCGITYQWQSAPTAGGPWTSVAGATTIPCTVSPPVGTTFYRCVVTCFSSGLSANSTTVSVTNTAPVPTNNECSAATPLTVWGLTCTTATSGTIACSSASADANSCFGTADDDVWYSFVAPASGMVTVNLTNVAGSTTDMYHSVYSGSCGSLTNLICSDPNTSSVSGLTPGQTYYIRVFTYTSTGGQTSTYDICVTNPCPTGAPSNDECSNAISVPVSSASCTSTVAGSISCSTASPQTNPCFGTPDDDVWFKFVATSPSHTVSLMNLVGTTTDLYHIVYSGTCSSLTSIACSDPNSSTLTGLTVGATYYIRVFSYTSTAGQTVTFEVCITTNGACGNPANNDYCSNPAVLTYTPSSSFSSSTAATFTADSPANTSTVFCGSIENNSWYQFVATATTQIFNFTSVTGCTSGIQAQVYQITEDVNGCCTNLTSVSNCWNPGTATTGTVTATPLTIGSTYVLMIDGFGGANCNYSVADWSATGILPVELLDFNGIRNQNDNLISWVTGSENNNEYFILERSFDGSSFLAVARIDGQGNSTIQKAYSYTDKDVQEKITYYRLRYVNYDGSSKVSGIVALKDESVMDITIYPNPAHDQLNFKFVAKNNQLLTVLYTDVVGKEITERVVVTEGITKFVSTQFAQLSKGAYIVKIVDQNNALIHSAKLIKQ